MNASQVIEQLETVPVTMQTATRPPPEGIPNLSGFYAWWAERGALEEVPERLHPLVPSLTLFYVGISPARASSKQSMRTRLLDNHINGNTSSSTFRFALASLLLADLALQPLRATTKVNLSAANNARLLEWQYENLRLTWCARDQPWEIEHGVIEAMKPPLNSAGNRAHPFYATIKASRAAFRAAAVTRE